MKKTIILLFFIVITAGVSAQSTEYVPLPKSLAPTKTGNTTERAVKFEVGGSFNFGLGGNTNPRKWFQPIASALLTPFLGL